MKPIDRERGTSSTASAGVDPPPGFNVIGFVSGNLGLGLSARKLTSLLIDKGCSVAVLDMDPGSNRARHDTSFDAYAVDSPSALPYDINLAMLPIHALPDYFLDPPRLPGRREPLEPGHTYWYSPNRLNVAVVWWEMTVLPTLWIRALEAFDAVIAPSPFIHATLNAHLSNVTVIPALHPLGPVEASPSRSRFDLPQDEVLFITGFEPLSDPERKNPFAAIAAFQQAFPGDSRANLVIKLNNASAVSPETAPMMETLRQRCQADPRIRVIDQTLSYRDVLRLYASCDVFVSLHRSEGLGLGLMESMALGKPVIATGWSGNMAFMDQTNACLVRHELIPARPTAAAYTDELLSDMGVWADPDVEEAAAWMKRLVDDPQLRADIGRSAALSIAQREADAARGTFVDEVLAVRRNSRFLPRPSADERLINLRKAFFREIDASRPYPQRMARKFRDAVDKHVLWRWR